MSIIDDLREEGYAAFLDYFAAPLCSPPTTKEVWDASWNSAMNVAAAAIQSELGSTNKTEVH